jgi:hypothetical protein
MRADLVGLGVRLGWVDPKEAKEGLATVKERLRHQGDGVLLICEQWGRLVGAVGRLAPKSAFPSAGRSVPSAYDNAPDAAALIREKRRARRYSPSCLARSARHRETVVVPQVFAPAPGTARA